ncbi:sulfotransferase 1A3-like isoform X1 [Dreissena polymorpha]|uniref:sulfotransferase 1A3-like isoform X1 n=1 Tax=Dreissena polymorpha TaxID=45954 RepID=UPI0022651F08|nr:sulfotransferase 1A3-like isoform X1 [Dreissena polymorpha]XP_052218417.1 sulfotransferase 1A3-like isoform X1 [Dreissena polymorpha]
MSRQYHHDVTDGDTILYDVIDEEPEAPYRLCVFMHETFEQKMEIMNNLPDLKCREQDLFLLSYPKTGTNWLWEIMTMITSGSQEVSASDKRYGMIEATPATPDALTDKLPDPRIINSHLLPKYLPKAVLTGKHKCVFIARNPKDAVVSFYNHTKGIKAYEYNGKFENYIQMFRRGEDLSSQAAYDALVDLVPLIEAAKVGSSLFLDCQGSNGHATETPQVTDEPAIVPVDATVPVSDVKFVATKVSEPTKKPQKNVSTGKTAKSNITVPAKCNITVPNPRSLKEMQLAYFQHQNSLSVAQEAYYLKMASLADKLNVLADIAIDKIHKNE